MRSIRLVLFVVLFSWILFQFFNHHQPKIAVFFFNLFVMFEVFFHYKISKYTPRTPLEKNKKETMDESFTMPALYGFIAEQKSSEIIKKLMKYPQIQLVMQKANISKEELRFEDIENDLLKDSTFESAQTFKGKFITTLDVFVAYLFLIESEAKLLFAKNLSLSDFYIYLIYIDENFHQLKL